MIEKCADYIAFYLVKNGLIEQDKMAIYKYGYEILISNIINISVLSMIIQKILTGRRRQDET